MAAPKRGLCLAICTLFLVAINAQDANPPAKKTTMDNLMTAFNGETNANVRYTAFAKKADEEGYAKVAVLFRAAARSEAIHARELEAVIKKQGSAPKADIKAPEVKSTKENVEAALKGETFEMEKMYPEFITQARGETNKPAVRAFNFAKNSEVEHAKLYKEALANLDSWKAKGANFFVCPECGFTAVQPPDPRCPVCATPKEKFEKIS
jgi:rubrerythrin